ncbi:TRAP transporter small permease [Pseudopelagicola sp. nBUS_19]|uniref:TRAP transporter small permease n=1 Tax=Pseudopelagicola sp. nBUS_19 TaxID=3395316 RepID=UPI003EBC1375
MKQVQAGFSHFAQAVAAAIMATMFTTFILQIIVRYSARLEWLPQYFPVLNPSLYGWTLEFCLLLWVWLIFWGNAFVVREQDHVTFDILFFAVRPTIRRWFIIIGCIAICTALLLSVEPTLSKFYILRLKKTATLSNLFGDWIRMRDIYAIYIIFLLAVSLRYGYTAYQTIIYGIKDIAHHDDMGEKAE